MLGWYVRTELERDDAENLDLRATAAGGATYMWQDTEPGNWKSEAVWPTAMSPSMTAPPTTCPDSIWSSEYLHLQKAGRIKTMITYNPGL